MASQKTQQKNPLDEIEEYAGYRLLSFEQEGKLLRELEGKLELNQNEKEKRKIVERAIGELFEVSEAQGRKIAGDILGVSELGGLLGDAEIEDVIINGTRPIYIYIAGKGMEKTDYAISSAKELDLLAWKLCVISGKKFDNGVKDFRLPTGERVNITPSPMGRHITIRKFKTRPMSVIDLIDNGTLDYDLAALLWIYTEGLGAKPANMLIGGMPGAGKTTLLNALFSFFPPKERIVAVEDTMELNTELRGNCARLETSEELGMKELVKNSLRMRPDRIIVGEVRGEEAKDLLTAMNIGKICMGTLHASTPREMITRLENKPMDVPRDIIPLIDVFLVVKLLSNGKRVLSHVSETGGMDGKVLLSDLYVYDPKNSKAALHHASVMFRDKLAEAAGINPMKLMDEYERRTKVLRMLHKSGARTMEEISEFCERYYADPEGETKKLASVVGAGAGPAARK
ncbi:putative KH and PIN-domain containing protein [Candidatus Gugararchaeum adminiculabundum]|nr:putative KH and PIN-domain containing protein [Candidatus Gugararchaeum adminiculabundum]